MKHKTIKVEELEPGEILLDARVGRVTLVTPPGPDARTQYTHVVGELGEVWMSGQEMVAVYAEGVEETDHHEPDRYYYKGRFRKDPLATLAGWMFEHLDGRFCEPERCIIKHPELADEIRPDEDAWVCEESSHDALVWMGTQALICNQH